MRGGVHTSWSSTPRVAAQPHAVGEHAQVFETTHAVAEVRHEHPTHTAERLAHTAPPHSAAVVQVAASRTAAAYCSARLVHAVGGVSSSSGRSMLGAMSRGASDEVESTGAGLSLSASYTSTSTTAGNVGDVLTEVVDGDVTRIDNGIAGFEAHVWRNDHAALAASRKEGER